ncbi:hypothetical protein ACEF17_01560 [Streptococcus hyovaginalis]
MILSESDTVVAALRYVPKYFQKEKSTVTTIDFVLFSLSEKLFHLSKG